MDPVFGRGGVDPQMVSGRQLGIVSYRGVEMIGRGVSF